MEQSTNVWICEYREAEDENKRFFGSKMKTRTIQAVNIEYDFNFNTHTPIHHHKTHPNSHPLYKGSHDSLDFYKGPISEFENWHVNWINTRSKKYTPGSQPVETIISTDSSIIDNTKHQTTLCIAVSHEHKLKIAARQRRHVYDKILELIPDLSHYAFRTFQNASKKLKALTFNAWKIQWISEEQFQEEYQEENYNLIYIQ